jgi:riboflavin synthase
MFTGLIEELGGVESFERRKGMGILKILASRLASELTIGESIAVNGVCLTVVKKERSSFTVEVSPHTLNSTTIGEIKPGDLVNLERALRFSDRVGGHLVTGHVDGIGVIAERKKISEMTAVSIKIPHELSKYLIPRGSVAVDGVSLTLASIKGDFFTVYIIPHTAKTTTLGLKGVGSKVNIEVDIIGKYVESLMEKPKKLTYEELIRKLGGN